MCRFLGLRASAPARVDWHLLDAKNALVAQSECDLRGQCHGDGWGIGYYDGLTPRVVRSAQAAFKDPEFDLAARKVLGRTAIAHIRDASVGTPALQNSHPFQHGPWLFAHNGTVEAFDRVGPTLAEETAPALLELRQGDTDSELVFYWLLSQMVASALDRGPVCSDLIELVGGAVVELANRCERAGASEPAKLNFLLTDGRVLLATRWRHSLFWHERETRDHQTVMVASEPIGDAAWREVPDGHILAVDEDVQASIHAVI